jgi:cell shape-determining protein MreD
VSWTRLIIAVLVVIVVQTTACAIARVPRLPVDLPLVLALVYAITAPAADARLAALLIGFAVDLTTDGPVGVCSFAFGLTGLVATRLRGVLNSYFWLGRLFIGLLSALPGQLLILFHLRYVQGARVPVGPGAVAGVVWACLVAAVICTLITGLPAFSPRRRAHAGGTCGHYT